MKRAFTDHNIWQEQEITLSPEESHHLLSVLRSRPGEIIEIFDGAGRVAQAELLGKQKNIARIRVIPESICRVEPYSPSFILLQAVPKQAGMESIVQKATELGVKTIFPVITERVVVKVNQRLALERVQRWKKIVLAAAKQCRTAWLPEIRPMIPMAAALAEVKSDLKIFGALSPPAPAFREFLMRVERPAVKSIALAIGPEGDFTDEECELLMKSNFNPVSFGSGVLRVETAVVFGLSVLNYEFRSIRCFYSP